MTAIDIAKAADAFASLAADRSLRRKMGEAGRARACARYDWRHVIAAYRALIAELAAVRGKADARTARTGQAPAQPARMDPFRLFGAYPTVALDAPTMLRRDGFYRCIGDLPGGFEAAAVVNYGVPGPAILDALLARLDGGPVTLINLVAGFSDQDRRNLVSGVAFLMKMGLIARA